MARAVLWVVGMRWLIGSLLFAAAVGSSGCFLFHETDREEGPSDAGSDDARVADASDDLRDGWIGDEDAGEVSWDGGTPGVCPDRAPPPVGDCGLDQCGDGDIDTCEVCMPCTGAPPFGGDAGTCCSTSSEICDGSDLAGSSCESLGYAGGELACGDWCGFDATGCERCREDARIVACGRAAVAGNQPVSLSLTTLGGDIVIAWVADRDWSTGSGAARVAVLDGDDLSVLRETGCLGTPDAVRVAVTEADGNLLVAVERPAGTEVIPLDGELAPRGASTRIDGAAVPVFARRPTGGPLMVFTDGSTSGGSHAALLSPGGEVQWRVELFDSVIEAQYASAVFVGDGFLVGQRADGVRIARVELDGTVSSRSQPDHGSTEYPQLVWTGTEAHLTYSDFGGPTGHIDFVSLSSIGERTDGPTSLGSIPTFFNVAPMVEHGGDVAILFGVYTGGTGRGERAEVGVYGADGSVKTAPFPLDEDPGFVTRYRMANLGDDLAVAWLTEDYPGAIQVARVSP